MKNPLLPSVLVVLVFFVGNSLQFPFHFLSRFDHIYRFLQDSDDDYQASSGRKLIFTQTVWRHGDRAPGMTYPNDPHDESAWPFGFGELTELGMEQQFVLGRLLRERYMVRASFLSRRYSPKEVYIRATDVNRTLVSGISNLAGMYPMGISGEDFPWGQSWPSHWTPIPIHTIPFDTDYVGNSNAHCPRATQIYDQEIFSSKAYRAIELENKDFFSFLGQKTGYNNFGLSTIHQLNDVIYVENLYKLRQPEWLNETIIERIEALSQVSNEFYHGVSPEAYSEELIRLRGGNMLKEMTERMAHKLECLGIKWQNSSSTDPNNTPKTNSRSDCHWIDKLKYYAYSAHDTTVAFLASTFGDEERIVPGGLPHYTAAFAMELWLDRYNKPEIKLLFHSAYHKSFVPITHMIQNCPESNRFCPYSTFLESRQKFIPDDIKKECQRKHN